MPCTLLIPVSSLPYVHQMEICPSSTYQPHITSQFRCRENPQKASSLLGRNHPCWMVSRDNLPTSSPMGVLKRWQCLWDAPETQLHLLLSMESSNRNNQDPELFLGYFWSCFKPFRYFLDQTCCQQCLDCSHPHSRRMCLHALTHTFMLQQLFFYKQLWYQGNPRQPL